jgi:hypothetical protein
MGVLYRIDVGDGAGVRSTATTYDGFEWVPASNTSGGNTPQPTLDRLDAFASIVNAFAPFNVKELCDAQVADRGVGEIYGDHFADVFDVGMLYVAELIGQWGSHPIRFILTDEVRIEANVDLVLSVDPPVTRREELIPARVAGFEVDDYIPIAGLPQVVTGLIVDSRPVIGIGPLTQLQTFPEPRNVNVLATSRWLPLKWALDPWCTVWEPFSGFDPDPIESLTVRELCDLPDCRDGVQYVVKDFLQGGRYRIRPGDRKYWRSNPGTNPQYRPRYSYYRDGGFVRNASVSLFGGRHMWCDDIDWNAQEVTVFVVATLHEPAGEWFGVLETQAPNVQGLDPFFGIRYHKSGVLALWADSMLLSTPLSSGMARPAQPVIIGLNIDMTNNTVTMLSADSGVKAQTTSLPRRYDNRSRLWLGRSPQGQNATASMDVLEVSYWERRFGPGDLAAVVGEYDRMYGVTTS